MLRLTAVATLTATLFGVGLLPAWAAEPVLDKDFAGDGRAILTVLGDDAAYGVATYGNESYVVGGSSRSENADCQFMVANYTAKGRLDDSFSGDGKRTYRPQQRGCAVSAAVLDHGRVAVAGWSQGGQSAITVVVLRQNGSLDRDFSGNGVQTIGQGYARVGSPELQVTQRGGLWVAWHTIEGRNEKYGDLRVAQIGPSGSIDGGFGDHGVKTVDVASEDVIFDSAIDDRDRLHILSWARARSDRGGRAAVVRIARGGVTEVKKLDAWKGGGGTYPLSIDIDASQRVLVGLTPTYNAGWGAIRLTDKLHYDDTFGDRGKSTHSCRCFSTAGVLTPDGLVLLGGTYGRDNKTAVVLFTDTGHFDRAFARDGKFNLTDRGEIVQKAAVDEQGRVVLAGATSGKDTDAYVARLDIVN